MVATHVVTQEHTKTKKNRRKISRKAALTADPSSSTSATSHAPNTTSTAQDADAEMVYEGSITDVLSGPIPDPVPPPSQNNEDDDALMIDTDPSSSSFAAAAAGGAGGMTTDAPTFAPLAPGADKTKMKSETRRIPIPPHRMTPLKKDWLNIFEPLTMMLGLQVRMNVQRRCVEARTSRHTKEIGALQKGADFVRAYALGFNVDDALALLRLDDLYLDSFEIKDVKTLHGDHLSRAIGRIAGQDGKTKFTIENTTRTRIVLADTKIHIMGSFQNIKVARDAIVSLILGSPPGKVYSNLRTVATRMKQRAI